MEKGTTSTGTDAFEIKIYDFNNNVVDVPSQTIKTIAVLMVTQYKKVLLMILRLQVIL